MGAQDRVIDGMPARVLLVENDGLLTLAMKNALAAAGVAEIRCCATAAAALKALDTALPDAIVLDTALDDRADGWAIAELLAALGPRHPAIVFTAEAPDEIPAGIAQLGMVLTKPYDPALLIEALRLRSGKRLLARVRSAFQRLPG